MFGKQAGQCLPVAFWSVLVRLRFILESDFMIRRINWRRFDWVFGLVLTALIINTVIPVQVTSATSNQAKASTTPVVSKPAVKPPSLPVIADKPVYRSVVVRSSAYSSTIDQTDGDPWTTASGSKVHDGVIAANGLPFGTKVMIPKYFGRKVFTVEDRMSAKWGRRKIDIWMTTRQAAKQWGVRTVTIQILS